MVSGLVTKLSTSPFVKPVRMTGEFNCSLTLDLPPTLALDFDLDFAFALACVKKPSLCVPAFDLYFDLTLY